MAKRIDENKNYKQRFMKGFHMLTGAKSLYTVWSDLMLLYSIEIANTAMRPLKDNEPFKEVWNEREEQYIKTIKTYNKKEQRVISQMFTMLILELATLVCASEICKSMFKKYNYQNHIMFVGQDIDITCVQMCYIQLSLHGLSGYVVHGNTLTEPEVTDLHRIWFTPMYFNNVWTMRRLFHGQDILGRERKQKENGKA